MTFKQKVYNLLAIISDYEGLHGTADSYRKGSVPMVFTIFNLLTIWIFPFFVLWMFILTCRFHKPNCDCKDTKIIKDWNKK